MMNLVRTFAVGLGVLVVGGLPTGASALTIDLDFDTSSFFYSNPTARSTIQRAASDISTAITSTLRAIDQHEWSKSIGPSQGQTLSSDYTWNFSYSLPGQGTVNVTPNLPANTVQLFVRGENIAGNTLGTGGSSGIGNTSSFGISYLGSINQFLLQNQFTTLVAQQAALAETEFTRGSGPVISTLSGNASLDFPGPPSPDATATYEVSYGPTYGTLALDTDRNNDGVTDSPASLTNHWHVDYATPVASGKNDLYSVALHEMLHALGVGSSETWADLSSGSNWTGQDVILEQGTGAGLVSGSHITGNTMSRRITDGAPQEAAMDPTLQVGTRKYLTTLDLAFLRDLGYSTILPDFSFPGDFNGDGIVDAGDYTVWRDNLGATTEAALSGNGSGGGGVDRADYTLWRSHFGQSQSGSIASSAAVPEPASVAIAAAAAVFGLIARRWSSHL